jgi:uncharacterized Ntn-hydrolase superfamily protein
MLTIPFYTLRSVNFTPRKVKKQGVVGALPQGGSMTYSMIARDPQTGELGIAVQSRSFAAGRFVPSIEAGVGVIASQSFVNPAYGPEGLRLLRAGLSPQAALETLLSQDPGAALRQVAILDTHGRIAAHTGRSCVAAAGHATGLQCSAQANMMAHDTVWPAMIAAFEHTSGDLAERLLAAMQAAERAGGDLRGRQAAALIVVPGQLAAAPTADRRVDLRIDDHPDPVGEIGRLLSYARAHERANQAVEKTVAGNFSAALDDLDACCAAYPEEPEFLTRRALLLLAVGRFDEAHRMVERAEAIHHGWAEYLLRFADARVMPMPRDLVTSLVAGLIP